MDHKILGGISKRGVNLYRNNNGKLWDAAKCPSCKRKNNIAHGRKKYGSVHRDEVVEHANKTGRDSEKEAKLFFEKRGFIVEMCETIGPDLTIYRRNKKRYVEVKTATKTSRRGFAVAPVSEKRKKDDLIVYVNGNSCVVRRMKEHLKDCCRAGNVSVTKYFRNKKDIQNNRVGRTTGLKGISIHRNKYRVILTVKGKQIHVGTYDDVNDAVGAYNETSVKYFGAFAYQNKI